MKTLSNDIFIKTRSVLNELRREGLGYDDSIMSTIVMLFVIYSHKNKYEENETFLKNEGHDFFQNLEFRANDPEEDTFYDIILKYLQKVKPFSDIIIKNRLLNIFKDSTDDIYVDLIEQLINDLSNNSRGVFAEISNDSINTAFSKVVHVNSHSRILDPCIGSGKLIVDLSKRGVLDPENVSVCGIEKNRDLALLSFINLNVNGFKNISIINDDALNYLMIFDDADYFARSFDIIISDLPLGVNLPEKSELAPGIPSTLRFYFLLIQKCRRALTDDGQIYISANSRIVKRFRELAGKDESFSIIAELIDVSDIASWSYTSVKPYILILDKEMPLSDAEITLAKLTKEGERDQLNYIDRDEFDFFSNIEDLGFFFSDAFDRIYYEGMDKFDTLDQFFCNSKKVRKNLNKNPELQGCILSKEFIQEASGFRKIEKSSLIGTIPKKFRTEYIVSIGDWVLAYDRDEIKVFISDIGGVALPLNCIALEPIQSFSELMQDWLIAQFRNEFLQTQLLATISDSRPGLFRASLKLNKLFIDKHSPKQKERFVSQWKETRIELLEKEKKKVESKFADVKEQNIEEQLDLVHDLHHSLKNELSIISGAAKSIKTYLERKSASSEPVCLDDPSREPRKGADPRLQKSVGERLMALLSASEEMTTYLNHYKTILKFDPSRQNPDWVDIKKFFDSVFSEFAGFTHKVIEKIDQLESKKSKNFHLKCDKSVLRLVLTNIISNAQKYGFTEDDIQYSFHVDIKEVPFDNESWSDIYPKFELPDKFLRIVISNDGQPLAENMNESEFFRKGFKHGASAGSGLGSYHIKKGIESMGGLVTLGNPKEEDPYNFQLVCYFPYPTYKTKKELIAEGDLA